MTVFPPASGLYVHIPFCIRRCLYCDFYIEPLGTGAIGKRLREFRSLQHQAFLRALRSELEVLPSDFRPETIYVGGGTPTELPPADLQQVFLDIEETVNCEHVIEFSCEANPGTMDRESYQLLAASKVNRVSLGVQSFDDQTLELLGRIHDADQARDSVRQLRNAGIRNLSVDLLFALPRTSMDVVQRNLEAISDLQPEHVSWYSLEYEQDTALTAMRDSGHLEAASEEQAEEEYQAICAGLNAMGYRQYELFSFAQPGQECLHNQNYWASGSFHGCGPSAYSHVEGTRSENVRDLGRYIHAMNTGERPISFEETLRGEAKAREALMIALRRAEGVVLQGFETQYGHDALDLIGPALQPWLDHGWIEQKGNQLRLLPEAYLISDSLFRELVPPC